MTIRNFLWIKRPKKFKLATLIHPIINPNSIGYTLLVYQVGFKLYFSYWKKTYR